MDGTPMVRDARREDAADIVDFNRAMARETEDRGLPVERLAAGVDAVFLDSSRGRYLVAEIDGVTVGSLLLTTEWSDWRNGVFWWIQSVYVCPEFRRRGVYRALHVHVRDRAASEPGVCGVRLYVERGNVTARSVYRAMEMEETSYRLFEEDFSA